MIRSPIWRHGGVVFGPRPRDFTKGMTKKMKETALESALLGKFKDGEVSVIEKFLCEQPKTKSAAKVLKEIGYTKTVLIGTKEHNKNTWLSIRNIPKIRMSTVAEFNAYDVLKNSNIILTWDAFKELVEKRKGTVSEPVKV